MVAHGVFGTGEMVAPMLPRNISISGKGGIPSFSWPTPSWRPSVLAG